MLKPEMIEKLNEQMNLELYSSLLYQQMSAWCSYHTFEGAAAFLRRHAQEEMTHMQRLFDYLTDTGNLPRINTVESPFAEYSSLDELFHIVLSREGKSISLFINGQKLSGFETSEVTDFGDISFMFSNASNLGLIRMWNYALSADEVATLYNNGDPMGYVVPSNYKILGDTYLSDFSEGADGWYVTPLTDYATMTVSDGAVVVSKDSVNQNIIIGHSHTPYNVQISIVCISGNTTLSQSLILLSIYSCIHSVSFSNTRFTDFSKTFTY